jgi:hypothetical protein
MYLLEKNVFYNDLRDPSAIDYSALILDWLRQDPVHTGIYARDSHAADMESTQFLDLECCVGKRYLYCHQVSLI